MPSPPPSLKEPHFFPGHVTVYNYIMFSSLQNKNALASVLKEKQEKKNDKNERETHRVFGFSFISLIAIVDEPHWSAHRSDMDLFLIKSTSCEGFGINRFKSPPVWDSRNPRDRCWLVLFRCHVTFLKIRSKSHQYIFGLNTSVYS